MPTDRLLRLIASAVSDDAASDDVASYNAASDGANPDDLLQMILQQRIVVRHWRSCLTMAREAVGKNPPGSLLGTLLLLLLSTGSKA